jgi:hypothetical protein
MIIPIRFKPGATKRVMTHLPYQPHRHIPTLTVGFVPECAKCAKCAKYVLRTPDCALRSRVNIAVSEWDRVTKIESSPETHNLRTWEPTNDTDCGRRPVNANDILESLTSSPKTYQSFTPLYQLSTLLSSTSQLASATVQFTWIHRFHT